VTRIIFITGTDTGVGKTVMTSLLLAHYRSTGINALAMKPFCCGGREDVERFREIQGEILSPKLLSPCCFREPLAPFVAACRARIRISFGAVLNAVRCAAKLCDVLLVEGAGGLLVPITERVSIADIAVELRCQTIVVARNRLGTINHTLLTLEALNHRGIDQIKVVMMGQATSDKSVAGNLWALRKIAKTKSVYTIPRLRIGEGSEEILAAAKKIKKTLARIADPDSFSARSSKGLRNQAAKRRD